MPELPEVETERRYLEPAMTGASFVEVELRRRNLRRPFVKQFAARLKGATVTQLDRRGKFLLASLSSGDTLVMHLGMSGAFRVVAADAGAEERELRYAHDHVVFTMSNGSLVVYNDPRRFGSIDLVARGALDRYAPLARMGPEPLDAAFTGAVLAAACAKRKTPIKVALLDQHVVAGVGNIYASEALHRAGLSPRRHAAIIATPSGTPRASAQRLADAIQRVLRDAIARHERAYRSSPFRVYERDANPCPTTGCGGTIRRITQAGRSTYYCPQCQH